MSYIKPWKLVARFSERMPVRFVAWLFWFWLPELPLGSEPDEPRGRPKVS